VAAAGAAATGAGATVIGTGAVGSSLLCSAGVLRFNVLNAPFGVALVVVCGCLVVVFTARSFLQGSSH